MNNCTILKIQSAVDVAAPKFGYIPFIVTTSANIYIRYRGNGKAYILENNGSYFTVDSGSTHKTETYIGTNEEQILHVVTTAGCTICVDMNQILDFSAFNSKINFDDFYGTAIKNFRNYDGPNSYGNIINLVNGQEMELLLVSSPSVTGDVKEFVEKAVKENTTFSSPSFRIKVDHASSHISFNGTNYQDYYIKEESGLLKVATNDTFTNILGSYDGTNWT